jgi:hypothetical protein
MKDMNEDILMVLQYVTQFADTIAIKHDATTMAMMTIMYT